MEIKAERNCKNNQRYEISYPDSVNFSVFGLRVYSIGGIIITVNALGSVNSGRSSQL